MIQLQNEGNLRILKLIAQILKVNLSSQKPKCTVRCDDSLTNIVLQSNFYTPKQLLQIILQGSEFLSDNSQQRKKSLTSSIPFVDSSLSSLCLPPEIPFKSVNCGERIIYSSAIAHQLARHHSYTVQEITLQLMDLAFSNIQNLLRDSVNLRIYSEVLTGLVVSVNDSGYLQFELTDSAIAGWLNILICQAKIAIESIHLDICVNVSDKSLTPQLFAICHAYARCCSLLRLAHANKLITLKQLEHQPWDWQLSQPDPIPWLTPTLQLQTTYPQEHTLIQQLFINLDDGSRFPLRCALDLSQAFQRVHSCWQLWNNLSASVEAHRQVYLALILLTQRQLYFLLEDNLKIHPPSHL